jgi:hypothetical protein
MTARPFKVSPRDIARGDHPCEITRPGTYYYDGPICRRVADGARCRPADSRRYAAWQARRKAAGL